MAAQGEVLGADNIQDYGASPSTALGPYNLDIHSEGAEDHADNPESVLIDVKSGAFSSAWQALNLVTLGEFLQLRFQFQEAPALFLLLSGHSNPTRFVQSPVEASQEPGLSCPSQFLSLLVFLDLPL